MAPTGEGKSQYHHYVPRFMLKKWRVEYEPPEPQNSQRSSRRGKGRYRKKPVNSDGYINMYEAESDTLHAGTPIGKAFGMTDMYKNDEDMDRMHHIEELFSKLESHAAAILRKLDNAVTGPGESSAVALPRRDVNTLRKFLFLLAYRSGRHARQFLEEKFDKATRNEVETFRQKYNLKDIPSVWLFNLRNMLESEHWEIPTNERILKSDRDLYLTHLENMQLAFYVSPDDCEFVLTDNGLGLWEGTYLPSMTMLGMMMSPDGNPAHISWRHTTTYPVSPKLLILLRNTVMSTQQRLLDSGVSPTEAMPSLWGDKIPDNSYFNDLPRTSATVHYSPPLSVSAWDHFSENKIDGKIVGSRVNDILTFRIHMLTAEQSGRVNAIRLENTPRMITFKSAQKLLNSVRFYETTEGTRGAGPVTGPHVYSKKSYASLTRQLKYLLEHGVPPPAAPSPPTASPSEPTGSAARVDSPNVESTAGRADAETPSGSMLDRLRARADTPSATSAKPSASPGSSKAAPASTSAKAAVEQSRVPQAPTQASEEDSQPKPRKPRLRRKLFPVPANVEFGTTVALQRLGHGFMQAEA